MKNNIIAAVLIFAISSCSKAPVNKFSKGESALIGKWKYVEQYVSIGGPGEWKPVFPAGEIIQFKQDGSFVGSQSFQPTALKFEFIDSSSVKLTPAANDSGYVTMGYVFANDNKELQLYPIAPYRCIEGCSSKFVRQ